MVDLPGLLLECVREEEFAEHLPRFDALVVDDQNVPLFHRVPLYILISGRSTLTAVN